jgi:hypothetical protein
MKNNYKDFLIRDYPEGDQVSKKGTLNVDNRA